MKYSQTRKRRSTHPLMSDKGVFHLPVRTAILVPSTTKKNKRVSGKEYTHRVRETRQFLAKTNGGYTSVSATGGYVSKEKGLIQEPVAEVVSYSKRADFKKNRPTVRKFLKKKGKAWGQESMGYEHEDDLYYVKT